MNTFKIATLATLCAALASPAWSQKGQDHGNNGHKGQDHGHNGKAHGNAASAEDRGGGPSDNRGSVQQQGPGSADNFVIIDRDRSTMSTYYREEFVRGNCPP